MRRGSPLPVLSIRYLENFREKVVSGFAWEAATRLIVQIASWVSTIWVARILVPDDYGIVAISGIFTGLGLKIAGMGLGSALVNRKILKATHVANVFWAGSFLAVFAYVLLYAIAPLVAAHFRILELTMVVRVAAVLIVLSSIGTVPRALAMRELLFKEAALISMLSSGILTAMTLTMALLGYGYWSLIISTVVAEGVLVVAFFWLVRYAPKRPSAILTVVPYLRYGLKITLAGVLGFANSQWAIIIASNTLGQTVTGYLQMARVLASLPMEKIGQIFAMIAFPAFSRIQSDSNRSKSIFVRLNAILYIVTLPMFIGLAAVADDLVPLLLGERWVPIVLPVQLICMVNVFAIGTQLVVRVLEGLARPDLSLNFQIILLIVMPASMVIGVRWGLAGMLVAWGLTFPIGYFYLVKKLSNLIGFGIRELFKTVLPAVISSVVMGASVLIVATATEETAGSSLLRVAIQVSAGATAYLIAIWLLDKNRLREVWSLVRR